MEGNINMLGGGDSCRVKWKRSIRETPSLTSLITQFLILNIKTNYGKTQIGKFCWVKIKNIFLKIRMVRLVDEKIKANKYIIYKPLLI